VDADVLLREARARIVTLEAQLAAVTAENVALRAENAALRAENGRLRAENAALIQRVTVLTARVAALERRLGSGGGGGGKGTPPPKRPSSGKPRGGQPGHKGHVRARPEPIDVTQEHPVTSCPGCGGPLEPLNTVGETFEYEAVERALRVLRHILHEGWCPRCKQRVRARAPKRLADSDYGPQAHAELAALRATVGATVGDLENFARTIWQHPMSGGQIVAMLDRVAEALVPTFWWIVERVTTEPVVYEDTTAWKVNGHRAVLWVFTTFRLTAYWIDPTGLGLVPRTLFGPSVDGGVVTDGAQRFQLVAHGAEQHCLAHPLRQARDLLALHPDRPEVVAMMTAVCKHLGWMIGLHPRRDALAHTTWVQYRARARRDLLRLAAEPWTDEDCLRMAKRIVREVDHWVMFLWDMTGEMEPTNSRAERALRGPVIDRKRMQQNRSLQGVFRDVIMRSVAATSRQLGVPFTEVVVEALLARTRDGPKDIPSPLLTRAYDAARQSARRPEIPVQTPQLV